jgi:hypothetical protein
LLNENQRLFHFLGEGAGFVLKARDNSFVRDFGYVNRNVQAALSSGAAVVYFGRAARITTDTASLLNFDPPLSAKSAGGNH